MHYLVFSEIKTVENSVFIILCLSQNQVVFNSIYAEKQAVNVGNPISTEVIQHLKVNEMGFYDIFRKKSKKAIL